MVRAHLAPLRQPLAATLTSSIQPREEINSPTTIDSMDAPAPLDRAVRLAATQATEGSGEDIFEPGYLEALRQDWPD
jgi:hypothetical protein